jgi:hypothetical protein
MTDLAASSQARSPREEAQLFTLIALIFRAATPIFAASSLPPGQGEWVRWTGGTPYFYINVTLAYLGFKFPGVYFIGFLALRGISKATSTWHWKKDGR